MTPAQLSADTAAFLVDRWLAVQALLRNLGPGDQLAIAAGFLVFSALVLGRVIADWVVYRRRHGQRQRLERIRQGYTMEAPRTDDSDRRVSGPKVWRGVLSRAEMPDSRLGRLRFALTRRIEAAGGRRAARITAIAVGLAGIGSAVVLGPLLPWALAVPVVILVALFAGMLMLRKLSQRRKDAFLQEFPEAIDMLVRAVRAGLPVSQAISSAAAELSGPVAHEFQRISDELAIGTDFATALANAAVRVKLQEFDFFVVTLALQRQTGGRLTEVLENLSQIIRGRSDMRAKVRALTADGRASSNVIGGLPIVAAAALFVLNPAYITRLVDDPAGRIMAAVAIGLIVVGIVIVRQMANLDVRG